MRQSLWIRSLAADGMPERVVSLAVSDSGGALPIWSADGKQIIFSVGKFDESRKQWVNETFRINADGSGREPLKIPAQDRVQDWSPDGAWLLTASSRNAKIGWQLYVMRSDGKDERQVTEGGNPFYARFSPDGRRLLYSDGTLKLKDRQGIWIVGRRRQGSPSHPPDGRRASLGMLVARRPADRGRDQRLRNPKNTGGSRSSISTARIARS